MRQPTCARPNLLEWWDVPAPPLQDDGDAIVQPLAVTRCDLDLSIANGTANFPGPFAIGHEAAGVVTEIGDLVTGFRPGDQVIVPFQNRATGTFRRAVPAERNVLYGAAPDESKVEGV